MPAQEQAYIALLATTAPIAGAVLLASVLAPVVTTLAGAVAYCVARFARRKRCDR